MPSKNKRQAIPMENPKAEDQSAQISGQSKSVENSGRTDGAGVSDNIDFDLIDPNPKASAKAQMLAAKRDAVDSVERKKDNQQLAEEQLTHEKLTDQKVVQAETNVTLPASMPAPKQNKRFPYVTKGEKVANDLEEKFRALEARLAGYDDTVRAFDDFTKDYKQRKLIKQAVRAEMEKKKVSVPNAETINKKETVIEENSPKPDAFVNPGGIKSLPGQNLASMFGGRRRF